MTSQHQHRSGEGNFRRQENPADINYIDCNLLSSLTANARVVTEFFYPETIRIPTILCIGLSGYLKTGKTIFPLLNNVKLSFFVYVNIRTSKTVQMCMFISTILLAIVSLIGSLFLGTTIDFHFYSTLRQGWKIATTNNY